MKNFKYLLLLFSLIAITFASCTKEDVIDEEINEPETEVTDTKYNPLLNDVTTRSGNDDALYLGCFSIDYPFSLTAEGEETEINSEDDFVNFLEGLEVDTPVDFVYPLSITYDDGTTEEVADGEALGVAFSTCIPDDWDCCDGAPSGDFFPAFLLNSENDCYDLVYPLTLVEYPSEEEVVVADELEFIDALANADESILSFTFPMDLVDADGNVVTAEDGESLFDLLLLCGDQSNGDTTMYGGDIDLGGSLACYELVYPFNVGLPDGTTVEVSDESQFNVLLLENGSLTFVFPMTIADEDGNEIVVNNDEEMWTLILDCGMDGTFGNPELGLLIAAHDVEFGGCYDIQFPISLNVDGTSTSVDSADEVFNAIGNSTEVSIEWPVTVVTASGETVVLNSFDDLIEVLSNC